ncbi:hypothetical protein [Streptomyces xantholiticus]|uniref:hypothetical protein n=1 Tax=Streptomyces xantholiticus TaxID=68285 RepID=UPI00167AF915|nr:hypothetical protein [Streptomyces xantholiticus]GGW61669.1 hypothetical protein GCM10010381_53550 [Streptomyces xantholiticus]
MTEPSEVMWSVAAFAALSGAFYVFLRWATAPLLAHLGVGVEYALNVVVVGLLMPEYWFTRVQRRISGHAAPFAYTYGDAVCALAGGGHRCAGAVLSALYEGAARLGHRGSLGVGTVAAAVVVLSGTQWQ